MSWAKNPGAENPETLTREWQRQVEARLDQLLPGEGEVPRELHAAMRYAVFPGGKRLRPLLVMGAAHVGGRAREALDAACAVELAHNYSLVHDDLPCMDDDDLRRGRPTCHRVFGQVAALLAGSALLTLAFGVLTSYPGELARRLVRELAWACGTRGLAGGQAGDLLWTPTGDGYLFVADAKTAALFRASLRMGGLVAGLSPDEMELLDACGLHLGRAFQIRDDLEDWRARQDRGGMNAVGVWGEEAARRRAREEAAALETALEELGERGGVLAWLARQAVGGGPGAI